MEREARFHEYVSQQPFRSRDVLDARFGKRITRRLGRAVPPALQGVVTGARKFRPHARQGFGLGLAASGGGPVPPALQGVVTGARKFRPHARQGFGLGLAASGGGPVPPAPQG